MRSETIAAPFSLKILHQECMEGHERASEGLLIEQPSQHHIFLP